MFPMTRLLPKFTIVNQRGNNFFIAAFLVLIPDKTLEFVKNNNGCQVQDVREYLGISRPLVSSILLSIEELDLITRESGEGRALSLKITDRGEKILDGEKNG